MLYHICSPAVSQIRRDSFVRAQQESEEDYYMDLAHMRPYSWPKCKLGMQTARQLGTVQVTPSMLLLQEHVHSNHLFLQ